MIILLSILNHQHSITYPHTNIYIKLQILNIFYNMRKIFIEKQNRIYAKKKNIYLM